MFLKFGLSQLILFTFGVLYLILIIPAQGVLSDHVAGKEITKKENIKTSEIHPDHVDEFKANKKSENVLDIGKQRAGVSQPENQANASIKGTSQLVLEGGGTIALTSTAQPGDKLLEIGLSDDNNHSKGSKPRKGVHDPDSSVVPRKGVDQLGTFSVNKSSAGVTSDPSKESTNSIVNDQSLSNKDGLGTTKTDQLQLNEKSILKATHPKKPVVVTDIEDVDDFEKYPIIQTSTTGEDYIIIGIVIVLGIWCSIFGALIFYRRAGEYWDRRHYRRMDFLVEGMYND